MGNGRPHDHPLTDLLVHGLHPFPPEVEELILKLHDCKPEAFSSTDHLLTDWQTGSDSGIAWLRERLDERE